MNTRRMNRLEELGRVDAEKAFTKKGARNLREEKKRIVGELKKADGGKVKGSEHPLAGREGNVKHRLKSQKQYKAITDTKKYKDASYNEKNKMLAKGGAYTKSAPDQKSRTSRADGGKVKNKKSKKEHPMKEERFQQTAQERLKKQGLKKSEIGDPRVGRGSKAYNENIMAKGGRALKKVQPHQKGLKKLPTKVRNKMGYMKKGGRVGMGKAMRGGGCVR